MNNIFYEIYAKKGKFLFFRDLSKSTNSHYMFLQIHLLGHSWAERLHRVLPSRAAYAKYNIQNITCHSYPGADLLTLTQKLKEISITDCTDLILFPSSLKWGPIDPLKAVHSTNRISIPNNNYLMAEFESILGSSEHFLRKCTNGRVCGWSYRLVTI